MGISRSRLQRRQDWRLWRAVAAGLLLAAMSELAGGRRIEARAVLWPAPRVQEAGEVRRPN